MSVSGMPCRGSSGVLTLNSGSSSLKIALFRVGEEVTETMSGEVTGIGAPEAHITAATADGEALWEQRICCANHPVALEAFFKEMAAHVDLGAVAAVGHRLVHGGPQFTKPQRLTARIEADLRNLIPLAPLHMPANLDGIVAARLRLPEALHYACFDTGFHADMPTQAKLTGSPPAMTDGFVRRYGFHGLSYAYIVDDLGRRAGAAVAKQRLLVAHLGAGASMAAISGGQTVDTTMGFSALAGLPMATRSGDIDPGLLLYLILEKGWAPSELQDQLYHDAGLLGLSGLSGDVETLLAAKNHPQAGEALAHFAYQARKHAGGLVALMGGVDRIIFTGGVGANAPTIRAAICEPLSNLFGIDFDKNANQSGSTCLTRPGSRVIVEAIQTNEALMIAREARVILEKTPSQLKRQV